MNIKILNNKKTKQKFIINGMKEYEKRLSRYCKITSEGYNKSPIKEKDYIIKISPQGKNISSEGLANKILSLGLEGKSSLVFIISKEEIPNIDLHLSLSPMDMDYELMTLVLYEQIYRSFTIMNHLPYHK